MALLRLRKKENVEGDFYVDTSCIDCDLCRQIAPEVFADDGDQSFVYSQPSTTESEFRALKALVTCPTASIGTVSRRSAKEAADAYPETIEWSVYFCGYAAESSYGASSYLIVKADGNLLIDSPRFAAPLVRRIEEMGGIRWMFLTHRDDIADHEKWNQHFGAERIIHSDDVPRRGRFEILLNGADPVRLGNDVLAIPTPGHTHGHTVLLFQNRFLFTGDHLWWSPNFNSLHASRSVCWYSWTEQTASMEKLLDFEFEWVLPGHGRRFHAGRETMKQELIQCIERMRNSGKKIRSY